MEDFYVVLLLGDFEPVSIKMAKNQNLSLNPSKISGMCGRLMCCLRYEHELYQELRKVLPPVGSELDTNVGTGKIVELNVLTGIATVRMDDGTTVDVNIREQGHDVKTYQVEQANDSILPCERNKAGADQSQETGDDKKRTTEENNSKSEGVSRKKRSTKSRRRRRNRRKRKPKQAQSGEAKQGTASDKSTRSKSAEADSKAKSNDNGKKTRSRTKRRRRKRRSPRSSSKPRKEISNVSSSKEKPTETSR